jgi:hypothetical protein
MICNNSSGPEVVSDLCVVGSMCSAIALVVPKLFHGNPHMVVNYVSFCCLLGSNTNLCL